MKKWLSSSTTRAYSTQLLSLFVGSPSTRLSLPSRIRDPSMSSLSGSLRTPLS